MSRTENDPAHPGRPELCTATGTTTCSICSVPTRPRSGASDSAAIVSTSGARASRRPSTARCHTPWRPGRFSAAIASSQMTPGRGHSSAAVIEQ
jgi:hypothetical protein